MKILLVNKQGADISRITAVLQAFGHAVKITENFDAATMVLDAFHYDLVIANIAKYDKPSSAFFTFVKNQKKMPVIAMVSDDNFSAAFRILKFDPIDVIVTSESEDQIAQLQQTLTTSFLSFELN